MLKYDYFNVLKYVSNAKSEFNVVLVSESKITFVGIEHSRNTDFDIAVDGYVSWSKVNTFNFPEATFLNKPKFDKGKAPQHKRLKPVSKKEILAVSWPLSAKCKKGMESFENALGDVPQWLLPAMVIRGKPGRGQGSHMWNPVLLAVYLVEHGWICNKVKLQAIMEESFPDWFEDWENNKELIFSV